MTLRRACIIVFLAAAVLYLPSLRNGFAYDDVVVIEQDTRIHAPGHILRAFVEPYWMDPELGLYRPLASASFVADWQIAGGSPAWFHFVNVIWNAAACALLTALIGAFAAPAAALAGGLLFAVHPVHVEAVANVVGRAELMAASFMLSALLFWVRSPVAGAMQRPRIALVALLYLLALASKESAVVLPLLIVLVDAARGSLRRGAIAAWTRSRAAAMATLALTALAFIAARTAVLGGIAPARLDPVLEVLGPLQQRLTALQAWPLIARLLLTPWILLADYGPGIIAPAHSPTGGVALGGLLLAGLIGCAALAWHRGHGRAVLVLLWVPVVLLPVSNLVVPIGIILAERSLYLAAASVSFGTAFALERLSVRAGRGAPDGRRAMKLAGTGLAVIMSIFAARTVHRIPVWRSTETVFDALARDRPDSFRAHWYFARAAAAGNRTDEALVHYGHALELWPYRRGLLQEAAGFAARTGHVEYARRLADHMIRQWPDDMDATRLLAGAALDMGDTASARTAIERGLAFDSADSILLRMRSALAPDSTP